MPLSRRFVAWVLIGELLFGLVVGVTIGMYSAQLAARERRASLERVSRAVVASLMPIIADQDAMRVDAQMRSILETSETGDIRCIRVYDGTGAVLAASESGPDCCQTLGENGGLFGVFTRPQQVVSPVTVNGVQIGSVLMEFAPYGLTSFLGAHVIAALIVILSVALVSAPWTAWLILRNVVEPVSELRDGARELAAGRRDLVLYDGRGDEIGELAKALDDLTCELSEKERTLEESYVQLETAYNAEAQAKNEIEQLNRMKSDFVAVASHELRTPLSVIRLYTEMLEEGELGTLSDPERQALASISSATSRLTSIVSDLMDAALLERGLLRLVFERAHIDELVTEAVKDADAYGVGRGVSVTLSDTPPEIDAWIDPLRIRQVLDNLLINAVKYSSGSSEVTVSVKTTDTAADISVIDGGRGVPDERRGELFRLFGRLEADDNRDTAGLGLGLAISARIAEAHGGSISHAPNPSGLGSVFMLSVPLGDPSKADEDASVSVVGGVS